ncbi:MAG TPA: polysaccharide deacetylase family protein [Desulfomonilia bacterium]
MKWTIPIRSAYTGILYYTGILNGRQSVILCYHRVLPAGSDELKFIQPGMFVTTETFEKHMQYIKKNYKIIPLEQLMENPRVENTCIITFDDGWYDNYKYAFPILKKYSIPATIFLATNLIGTNTWAWPDRISYYINSAPMEHVEDIINMIHSQVQIMPDRYIKGLSSRGNRSALADELIGYLKMMTEGERISLMALIDNLMKELLTDLNRQRPWMTWPEIIEMSLGNVSFGAHSHNHVILTQTNIMDATREITDSRNTLEDKLGKPVATFSYPNGNYNNELMQIIDNLGFKLAVTTKPGMLDESENLLALRRILIHNDMTNSKHMFVYRITKKYFNQ